MGKYYKAPCNMLQNIYVIFFKYILLLLTVRPKIFYIFFYTYIFIKNKKKVKVSKILFCVKYYEKMMTNTNEVIYV